MDIEQVTIKQVRHTFKPSILRTRVPSRQLVVNLRIHDTHTKSAKISETAETGESHHHSLMGPEAFRMVCFQISINLRSKGEPWNKTGITGVVPCRQLLPLFGLDRWLTAHRQTQTNLMTNPLTSNLPTHEILVLLNLMFTVIPPTLLLHDCGWDMYHSFDVSETDQVGQQFR